MGEAHVAGLLALWLAVAAEPREPREDLATAHARLARALESGSAEAFVALRPAEPAAAERRGRAIEVWRGRLAAWREMLGDPWVRLQQERIASPPRFVLGNDEPRRLLWVEELDVPAEDGNVARWLHGASWEIEGGDWTLHDLHLRFLEPDAGSAVDEALAAGWRARSFEEVVRTGRPAAGAPLPAPRPGQPAAALAFDPAACLAACLDALRRRDGAGLVERAAFRLHPDLDGSERARRGLERLVARFEGVEARLADGLRVEGIDGRVHRLRWVVVTARGRQEITVQAEGRGEGGSRRLRLVSARWEEDGRPTLLFPGPFAPFLVPDEP